ncbi:MAG: SMP-30/gluconolactonase/LRE family protein, partial [Rubrobacter sp.]
RIYFSDPRYNGYEPLEQPVQGVYRIDPDGSIERIISNAGKPNGVLVSPDQSTLYVNVNDQGVEDEQRLSDEELDKVQNLEQAVYAYDLNEDGTVGERRKIVDYLPEAGPDGLEADTEGNIYVAVRDETAPGVYVYSPEGEELARIPTDADNLPTNVGFGRGEDSDVLYVTAGNDLYRIGVDSEGYQLPTN